MVIKQLVICSSRAWIALFAVYTCTMLYGILSLTNKNATGVRQTSEKEDYVLADYRQDYSPGYENEGVLIALGNDTTDPLRSLPKDFPLSRGLAKPIAGFSAGKALRNATIAVGIPTVKREGGHDYLIPTLESLFKNLSPENKKKIVFVVYVGETNTKYVEELAETLKVKFPDEFRDGGIEVISPSPGLYPNWSRAIRPSFGDSLERVKWRSKQNLDQIFLMMYIYHLHSKYYLMMEDDVISSRNYMKTILEKARSKENLPWIYLSFCSLGAIGKLYRHHMLPSYAAFLHTFWNAKPLDWLQIDFARSKVCSYDEKDANCHKRLMTVLVEHHPSQFQHVGKFSSLSGKIQNLRDNRFKH